MIRQLTKEMLLERVSALEDGTVIDSELLQILTLTDDSESVVRTIRHMSSMLCSTDGKYVSNMITTSLKDIVRNDLIERIIKERDDVTNVDKPMIGVVPSDLDHPIQHGGMDYRIVIGEKGGFIIEMDTWMLNETDDDSVVRSINDIIERNKWSHTYIYSITTVRLLDGRGIGTKVNMKTQVRMNGVTDEWIKRAMEEKHEASLIDKMFGSGYYINQL